MPSLSSHFSVTQCKKCKQQNFKKDSIFKLMKIEDFASDLTLRKLQIRFVNGLANSSQNDSYIQDSACQKGCQIGHIEGTKMEASKVIFYILQVSFHAIDS